MHIRALAIFERVVHNCIATSLDHPARPTLDVDALLRPGDDDGPLLVPAPAFMALVGGPELADPFLRQLNEAGRLTQHQGITHISFPLWNVVDS